MEHDGRAYSIDIPRLEILECESCKTRVLTDSAHKKLSYALRKEAGLLLPEQIQEYRKMLGLNQEQLAGFLNVAKETVCRWEKGGQIQQRAMDTLLRIFFNVPQARAYLGVTLPQPQAFVAYSNTGYLLVQASVSSKAQSIFRQVYTPGANNLGLQRQNQLNQTDIEMPIGITQRLAYVPVK
jgi:putative zinc finger/helix-turn-helix YgiT family protein